MPTRKEYLDSIIEAAVRLKRFPDEVVFIDELQHIDRDLWFMHDNACDHVALKDEEEGVNGAQPPGASPLGEGLPLIRVSSASPVTSATRLILDLHLGESAVLLPRLAWVERAAS